MKEPIFKGFVTLTKARIRIKLQRFTGFVGGFIQTNEAPDEIPQSFDIIFIYTVGGKVWDLNPEWGVGEVKL